MAEMSPELFAELETLEQKHAEHPQGRYFVPLANAYRKAGRVEQAETLIRDGLRHHPDYLSAHIVLGRCLRDRGAVDEAEETFRRVLDTDSQNLVALRSLGELAATSGRTGEARHWLERLVSVDPLNDEARELLDRLGEEEAGAAGVEVAAGDGFELPSEAEEGEGEGEGEGDAGPGEPVHAGATDEEPGHGSLLEEDLTLDAGAGGAHDEEPSPPWGLDTFEPIELEGDEPFAMEADLEVSHEVGHDEPEASTDEAEDLGLITFDGPVGTDDASLSGGTPPGGSEAGFAGEVDRRDAGEDAWDGPLDLDIDLGADDGAGPGALHEPEETGADEPGDAELATRTMADLYARQGFHDRAAEVYRRLLREGGEDPELRQRLEECEAATAVAAGGDEDADPFADSFAEGFIAADASEEEGEAAATFSDDPEGDDPHELDIDALERAFGEPEEAQVDEPQAEGEPAAPAADLSAGWGGDASAAGEPEDRETIGDFLTRLARWSPAEEREESEEQPEEEGQAPVAAAPDVTGGSDPVIDEAIDEAVTEEPVADEPADEIGSDAEPAPWEVTPEPAEAVHEEESDEGLLPWEEPAGEEAAAEGAAPDLEPWEEPIGLDSEAVDASAAGPDGDPGSPPPQEEAASGEDEADRDGLSFDRYFAEEEPGQAAASAEEGAGAGDESSDAGADDDDLESFQAWLQSLKT
jgi:tetratricopeptide (TPR) repeat protein